MTFFEGLSLTVPSVITMVGWFFVNKKTIALEKQKARDEHAVTVVKEIWRVGRELINLTGNMSGSMSSFSLPVDGAGHQKLVDAYKIIKSDFIHGGVSFFLNIELFKKIHQELSNLSDIQYAQWLEIKRELDLFDQNSTLDQAKLIETKLKPFGLDIARYMNIASDKMLGGIFNKKSNITHPEKGWNVLGLIFSLCMATGAIGGLFYASWNLGLTREIFVKENRPYLTIEKSVGENGETEQFLSERQISPTTEIKLEEYKFSDIRFTVKNFGKSPAYFSFEPKEFESPFIYKNFFDFKLTPPCKISGAIFPGESIEVCGVAKTNGFVVVSSNTPPKSIDYSKLTFIPIKYGFLSDRLSNALPFETTLTELVTSTIASDLSEYRSVIEVIEAR